MRRAACLIFLVFSLFSSMTKGEIEAYPYPLAHSLTRWVHGVDELHHTYQKIDVFYLCETSVKAQELAIEFPNEQRTSEEGKWLGYTARVIVSVELPKNSKDHKEWIIEMYYIGDKHECVMDGFKGSEKPLITNHSKATL